MARRVAAAAHAIVRGCIALHPRDFRESYGATVIHETAAEIEAAVPAGVRAVITAAVLATGDAARGAALERTAQLTRARKAMQNALLSDIRFAMRALWRDRSFSAVAVGTLSVGLALCISVAAFVNAYLVRGLPYPEADRLFDVRYGADGIPPPGLDKLDWRTMDDLLEFGIAWDLDMFNLRGGAFPEVAEGAWVTPGYVEGFGVRPGLGRTFEPSDFEAGRPMVAMISHRLWQTRFGGDPAIVGRGIDAYVNDRPNEVETFTIVGVLPRDHWHLNRFTDMLAPLRAAAYPYMVRVRDGVPPATAAERMTALIRTVNTGLAPDWHVELQSTHDSYVRTIRPLLLAVATATGLVLLIACANVGVLLTVRATRRANEMAVRQALGATIGQITRACAAEPLLIGGVSLMLGLSAAWATLVSVSPVVDRYLGRTAPGGAGALRIDPATLALAAGGALLAIALCATVPILIVRRSAASNVLAGSPRGATGGPGQRHARSVMVAVEVAASLTLLIGAGLAIESAFRMIRVDMGLHTDNVLVGRFNLRQRVYPDAAARGNFYERVLARAGELNGVDSVAFTNAWPLQPAMTRDMGSGDSAAFTTRAGVIGVSPDYFRTLGIPLRHGRVFTAGDRLQSEPVTVISHTLAARLWPRSSAIDQQLRLAPPPNSSSVPLTYRVIGIVGDARHSHTDEDLADAYVPLLQAPSTAVFTYLRVTGDASAAASGMRRLLASLDPDVGLAALRPLAEILDSQRASLRLLGYLLVVFAIFAATLALVGIYGVISYTVKQREREIAVRLAIGADAGLITRMFVGHGAVVLGSGLLIGVGGAIALGRIMQAQLFGVQPADPLVIAVMTATFAICGLLAVAWPARSAAAVDPAAALKE